MRNDDEDQAGDEPCFMDKLVDGHVIDGVVWRDVNRFRKAERVRLYAARKALSPAQLQEMSAALRERLRAHLGDVAGLTLAIYWPIRGEPDLRAFMQKAHLDGARTALPVVIEKNAPVIFREWTNATKMTRGIWNIPVPEDGPSLTPDVVIVPLLGVDRQNYRLGNGGGYYDRTLARLPSTHRIGVGAAFAQMETIFPMPFDIPMDEIILV